MMVCIPSWVPLGKDNGKEHIEFVHHIPDDMNEGKMEYVKFKKVGLNNCESFS